MTILGISIDQPEFSSAAIPAYSLMDLKNIGPYSLGQEVLRVGIYIDQPVSHDCVINFALYDITDTDYENNATGQDGPAGAIKVWEGSLFVSVGTPTGWVIQELPRAAINCADGRILGYALALTSPSIVYVRRTSAPNGGSGYTGEDLLPEIWEHSAGIIVNMWAFVELDIPPAGLSEIVPPAVDAANANYTNNNLPQVIGFHPWDLPFETQGTTLRHTSSTVGNWLNILGAAQVDANHKVTGIGVQINIAAIAGTQLNVALYKLTDLLGDAPYGPVKVWEQIVTLPTPIYSTTWLYFSVPDGQIEGIENGDTLALGFSGAEEGKHYNICVSVGTGQISHYSNINSLELPEEFISSNATNAVINGYVELQPAPGLFEVVPAAVDALSGEVENPAPAGKKIEIAIDWARAQSPDSSGYNVLRSADEGIVPLLDVDGEPTGITHQVVAGVVDPVSINAGSDFYGVPRRAWEAGWRTASGGTAVIELAGFAPGQSIVFDKMSGYVSGTNYRPTQVHINDIPIRLEPRLAEYTPVDPAINVPVVADSEGKLTISFTKTDDGQFYGYLNLAVFSYTTGAPVDEFIAEMAEFMPAATDAIAGTVAAPIYTAAVTELVPAAADALQGSYADAASFAGAITEALPAALDAGTGTFAAPGYAASIAETLPAAVDAATAITAAPEFAAAIAELVPAALDAGIGTTTVPGYAASIAESVPAASDVLLVGYVLAPVAGDVAELVPAAVDAAQGSFALNAAGAVIAESVPAAVDALAGSVGVPVFAGAVAEVVPPAADQAAAQFAPHRFVAVVTEAVPAAQDAAQASHFIEPVSGFIAELLPAAVDAVAGFFVPIPDAHSGIAEQVPAAVDALSATAAVPQYAAILAEVLPAAMDAARVITREYDYQPDAMRAVLIEPERRAFFVEPESRVFFIAPERRTLTVGV